MRREIGDDDRGHLRNGASFMKLSNRSPEVFYIWELNTLYSYVKNQSHFGQNINIPISTRFTYVEEAGQVSIKWEGCVSHSSAGKPSVPSHFPSNMQKFH